MPTQSDIILALEHVCDAVPDLATVKASLEAMRTLIPGAYDVSLTDEEETGVLKAYTGNVSLMNLTMACYPLGYPTTALFDGDGNLID